MKKTFYFGVDIGATFTKMALVDEECRIVAREKVFSRGFSDKTYFIKTIKKSFNNILSKEGVRVPQIKAIGIGLPGPVDFKKGIVLSLINIKGWHNFHLAAYLKKFFSVPVFIENDANCMALAESRIGAAKGASYVLCVTLGTGVGGGLILNREIYRSPYFLGGEVGHVPIALDGPRCECGGFACLERYVGNQAIKRRVRKEFKKDIPLEEVSRLARKGDFKAKKIWEDVGQYVGLVISGVVNIFNPEVVVVGGGVSLAGEVLLDSIRRSVKKHAMMLLKKHIKVKKAALGNDAGVLGAALLAKEGTGA